jgi:5-(carboxyamino)imidazole ribonucleotide synthase
LRSAEQFDAAWEGLGGRELIAEQWVPFDYEVSAIGVRNIAGETATYCLTHNEHVDGILRISRAPGGDDALTQLADEYMQRLLKHLDYVGVLALELFVADGALLANEFAPRVHNSGHWTIEGAATSQFANHILAITSASPGATDTRGYPGMINLVGQIPAAARQGHDGSLHDYGKAPRAGRKLGHITVIGVSGDDRDRQISEIADSVTNSTTG